MIDNSLFFFLKRKIGGYTFFGQQNWKFFEGHFIEYFLTNIWFLCDALHFTTFKTNIIYIIPVVKAKILQRKETGGSIFENVVYTVKVTTVYKVKLFRLNLTVVIILSVRL